MFFPRDSHSSGTSGFERIWCGALVIRTPVRHGHVQWPPRYKRYNVENAIKHHTIKQSIKNLNQWRILILWETVRINLYSWLVLTNHSYEHFFFLSYSEEFSKIKVTQPSIDLTLKSS